LPCSIDRIKEVFTENERFHRTTSHATKEITDHNKNKNFLETSDIKVHMTCNIKLYNYIICMTLYADKTKILTGNGKTVNRSIKIMYIIEIPEINLYSFNAY